MNTCTVSVKFHYIEDHDPGDVEERDEQPDPAPRDEWDVWDALRPGGRSLTHFPCAWCGGTSGTSGPEDRCIDCDRP